MLSTAAELMGGHRDPLLARGQERPSLNRDPRRGSGFDAIKHQQLGQQRIGGRADRRAPASRNGQGIGQSFDRAFLCRRMQLGRPGGRRVARIRLALLQHLHLPADQFGLGKPLLRSSELRHLKGTQPEVIQAI